MLARFGTIDLVTASSELEWASISINLGDYHILEVIRVRKCRRDRDCALNLGSLGGEMAFEGALAPRNTTNEAARGPLARKRPEELRSALSNASVRIPFIL